jgi:hypothetical protein
MSAEKIGKNVADVRERIANAARKAGRRAEEITLIAVSKTHPVEAIREAFAAGIRHFGETGAGVGREARWSGRFAGQWHLIGTCRATRHRERRRFFMRWTLWMIMRWHSDWTGRGGRQRGGEAARADRSTVAAEETRVAWRGICCRRWRRRWRARTAGTGGLMCIPPLLETRRVCGRTLRNCGS